MMMFKIAVWTLVAIVTATFVIYTAFFQIATAKRVRDAGIELPWDMRAVAYFWLVVGWPADIVFNFTRGTWIFRELPHWGDWTFSARIQRIADHGDARQRRIAGPWIRILNRADKGHIRI